MNIKLKIIFNLCFLMTLVYPWSYSFSEITIVFDVVNPDNTPEAAVATAIEGLCPGVQNVSGAGSIDTARLAGVCRAIQDASQTDTRETYQNLSARSATSILSMLTHGPLSQPVDVIDKRLAALRRVAESSDIAHRDVETGQTLQPGYMGIGGAAGSGQISSNWGGFLTANYTRANQDETQTLAGFESDTAAAVMGFDYRFSNALFAGVATRLLTSDVDLDSKRGTLNAFDANVTLYSTFFVTDNLYLDGTVHYGSARFDLDRKLNFSVNGITVNETANSDTDSNQYGASFGVGYDWRLAKSVSMQFVGNVRYNSISIDGYTETNASGINLRIDDQDFDALTSRLGMQFSVPGSYSWGVLVYQFDMFWMKEYKADGEKVQVSFEADPSGTTFTFISDDLDENYYSASIGAVFVLKGGLHMFIQYESYFSYQNYDQKMISLGTRIEF